MHDILHGDLIARFFGVLGTNLILSGDNAVVIAMAGRRLQGGRRKRAIFWGAIGAVGLRMVFALVITLLLAIPFLQAMGGLMLFWIAWQLARGGEDDEDEEKVRAGASTWAAVKIIIAADAVMSLDNVLALVGVSGGNLWLLGIGLALTIPLVVWRATLLSALLERFPILVYAGGGFLAWVGLEMIFKDEAFHGFFASLHNGFELWAKLVGMGIFVVAVLLWPPGGRSGGSVLLSVRPTRWSRREASRILLRLFLEAFLGEGQFVLGLGETLKRGYGKKISARGVYRDPVSSIHETFAKRSGLTAVFTMIDRR